MKKQTGTEKEGRNSNAAKVIWNLGKAISLIIAAITLMIGVMNFQNANGVMDAFASSGDNGESLSLEMYSASKYNMGEVSLPYTSIYDITINDQQLLMVCKYIDPDIIRRVTKELPSGTPNEFLLRCAYYNAADVEDALNTMIGVTLSADWRTDTNYVPTNAATGTANQSPYDTNGEISYNAYGDNN